MTELQELYRFARQSHITVDRFPLDTRPALSVMDDTGQCFIAMDPSKLCGESDERAKLAHELGHCATGAFYNPYTKYDLRRRQENKADKWAVRRIVAAEQLAEAVAGGCTELWELAEHFGVPESFMRKALCWYTFGNLAEELYF